MSRLCEVIRGKTAAIGAARYGRELAPCIAACIALCPVLGNNDDQQGPAAALGALPSCLEGLQPSWSESSWESLKALLMKAGGAKAASPRVKLAKKVRRSIYMDFLCCERAALVQTPQRRLRLAFLRINSRAGLEGCRRATL
jgi:hypothetical protein